MSDIADRVRTAIHNPLGHAQGGTLGELVEAAVMGMYEAGVLADLEAAAPSSVREGGDALRERAEYKAARAAAEMPGEFDEIARVSGGVNVEKPGVVDVFIQHYEDSVEHTPDEARKLAWALLVAADIAEEAPDAAA